MNLTWQITDADTRGVGYWSLPVSGQQMDDLLRGSYVGPGLRAVRRTKGRLADVIALGWVGILGVSTRFIEATTGLVGLRPVPLELVEGPSGYFVIGSIPCPAIDYSALREVGRMGKFITVEGFVIPGDGAVGDFGAPAELHVLMCSDRAAAALQGAGLTNLRLTPASEARLIYPEERLAVVRQSAST